MTITHFTGNTVVGLVGLVITFIVSIFLIFVVHRHYGNKETMIQFSFPRLPRILPWTIAAQIRKTKAKAELANAQRVLYEMEHTKLQKKLILTDLENDEYARAIAEKSESTLSD